MEITKRHIDRIATVDTARKAFNALRALGYSKSGLQLTRGATTYTHAERGLSVSIPTHGEAFIILDTRRRADGETDWGFISAALNIGNLKDGATGELARKVQRMIELGVLAEGQHVTALQLAVAMVTACHTEAQREAA